MRLMTPLCCVCCVFTVQSDSGCNMLMHDAAQRWKTLTAHCMIGRAAVEKSFGTPFENQLTSNVLLIFDDYFSAIHFSNLTLILLLKKNKETPVLVLPIPCDVYVITWPKFPVLRWTEKGTYMHLCVYCTLISPVKQWPPKLGNNLPLKYQPLLYWA